MQEAVEQTWNMLICRLFRLESIAGNSISNLCHQRGNVENLVTCHHSELILSPLCRKAKMMLDDIVSRGRGGPPGQFHDNANGQNGTVQEIMIPAGKAGLVIGKGGETIKQLQVSLKYYNHPYHHQNHFLLFFPFYYWLGLSYI